MEDVQKEEQSVLESIYAADFSMSGPREGTVRLHAPQDEDTNAKDNDGEDLYRYPPFSLVGLEIDVPSACCILLYCSWRVYCRTVQFADRCQTFSMSASRGRQTTLPHPPSSGCRSPRTRTISTTDSLRMPRRRSYKDLMTRCNCIPRFIFDFAHRSACRSPVGR